MYSYKLFYFNILYIQKDIFLISYYNNDEKLFSFYFHFIDSNLFFANN